MAGSTVRAPMPPSKRAKIFAPFDALKGLTEAIAAKEKISIPKKELSEDRIAEINTILAELKPGQIITVVYYGDYEQHYLQKTGRVSKVDPYWHMLFIDNVGLDFSEIDDIQFPDDR